MENEKIKQINNKNDAIIFLNQLIVLIDKRMMKFKTGIKDLEKELKRHNESDKKINTTVFDMHDERMNSLTVYLLNLFGDETKTAVSYKQFRNIVDKKQKNKQLDLGLDELESDIIILLNQFREERNWALHVPQSLLNSQIDYMINEEDISEQFVNFSFSQPEVVVMTWEYQEIEWFRELHKSCKERYEKFSMVFQRIKRDYSKLIGKSIRIIREPQQEARPFKYSSIPENSFDINTGKRKKKNLSSKTE